MSTSLALNRPQSQDEPGARQESHLAHLGHVIDHAAHLLPEQGPITVFIHHNTLHAFEDLPFTEGVKQGAGVFGCQVYLPEDQYREALGRGRIRFDDLKAVLLEDLGERAQEPLVGLGTRLDLRLAMLRFRLRSGPTEELVWFVAETDALKRVRPDVSAADRARLIAETRRWVMRDLRGGNEARNGHAGKAKNGAGAHPHRPPANLTGLFERYGESAIESWDEGVWEAFTLQALWRLCLDAAAAVPGSPPKSKAIRHRDLLLEATGEDSDLPVHDVLWRFCAAFLDQGFAHWQLPHRDEGFFRAFCALYRQPLGPPDRWMHGLASELARLEDARVTPLESIAGSLDILGVAADEWEPFLSATLLALPGWLGMVRQVEQRGDRVARPVPAGSLVESLAVRLILERFALAYTARETLGYTEPLAGLRAALAAHTRHQPPSVEQRAFQVFQLAQVLGWAPSALSRLEPQEWAALMGEIEAFSGMERRRIFHLAYERRFVTQSLDAIALHQRFTWTSPKPPRFQASFCLDDREESIRRHLEEVAPDVETFGLAGFYGVAMYFRGAADAHFVPLCPIVVRPQHWVAEQVVETLTEAHERKAKARRVVGAVSHRFHVGSRSFALGALLSVGLGVLASAPLIGRILFPRLTARIRRLFGKFIQAPPETRLKLERHDPTPGPENGHLGYSVEEMANVAERQLRDMGLTSRFARLVFLIGHGSFSLNNPHKSAYDCGACGGTPGAPNGRALAQMVNDPRVREGLASRGLKVPDDTHFIGGFHNTCNDTITLFDVGEVPASHQADLEAAHRDFDAALARNAHERCRRFMSAPLTMSFEQAHQHVEERSEDLAQTRPELGHATNALCFVGRRERTRGLFFDRRMFLTTYDPTQDDENATILTRLLQAAVPVCAGITLEYYFSRVDSTGWGCGTKLPHNVTALLGVMDGAASDLRTGLPWQMVEIHEPVRLLFILETTPAAILGIMDKNPGIGRVIRNGWALLAVLDPDSNTIQVYKDGAFYPYQPEAEELPWAASSVDWYRGWRDHLEFAEIG